MARKSDPEAPVRDVGGAPLLHEVSMHKEIRRWESMCEVVHELSERPCTYRVLKYMYCKEQ